MGLTILLALVLTSAGPEVQVGTLDGATVSGSLVEIRPDAVVVSSDAGDVTLGAEKILSLTRKSAPEKGTSESTAWIELTDGSRLEGTGFRLHDAMAVFDFGADQFSVGANVIHAIHFSRPGDPKSLTWPAGIGSDATQDLLVVRKKNAVDFLEGTISSIDDAHLFFKAEGESIAVALSKVDGVLMFHKGGDKLPDPACIVDDARGWQLKVKKLTSDGQTLHVTTLAGPTFELPLAHLARIDFSAGKVTYVSDLDPEQQQWTPYLDFGKDAQSLAEFYAPRRDEGRNHEPIQVRGKVYTKGISLTSRTALEYRVPSGAKHFKTTAAIDDSVRQVGNVRLEIWADGKKLFDKEIAGSDEPAEIDLDVAGARRLSVLVDYGKGMDTGDYLNLADARIVK